MNSLPEFDHFLPLSPNLREVPKSATLAINEKSKQLIQDGHDVVRLGLGQSPFPVPPTMVSQLQSHAQTKDYMAVQGYLPLREAIAEFLQRSEGIEANAGQILIGPGSKELFFGLQMALNCELLLPAPSWVSYQPQAKLLKRHSSWLPCRAEDGWKLTAATLEQHCQQHRGKRQLLVLNSPNNPSGACFSEQELRDLAAVARKYRLIILSDEIYSELHYQAAHQSMARYYPEGTIISSGLSKWCGAGGWRLGTFAFPAALHWLLEGMAAVSSETFTATSAPIQYAAVRAFRGGPRIEEYLSHSRRILKALSDHVCSQLAAKGAMVAPPQGAFYIFPDFTPLKDKLAARGISNSTEMCEKILEQTGVALLPGTSFGRPDHELTTRLALVDFDGAKALSTSGRYPLSEPLPDDFLGNCCFKVVEGIDRLCDWINGN